MSKKRTNTAKTQSWTPLTMKGLDVEQTIGAHLENLLATYPQETVSSAVLNFFADDVKLFVKAALIAQSQSNTPTNK